MMEKWKMRLVMAGKPSAFAVLRERTSVF